VRVITATERRGYQIAPAAHPKKWSPVIGAFFASTEAGAGDAS
jgi:hypothetical protein